MGFDEQRLLDQRRQFPNSSVEPFDVTDLQYSAGTESLLSQFPPFFESRCERLLDQHVQASFDTLSRYMEMIAGRHSYTGRHDIFRNLIDLRRPLRIKLAGYFFCTLFVCVHHTRQLDVRHIIIEPSVVVAEMTDTYYCNMYRILVRD